ncbi:MAG: Alpha/Beta hydrolase protein [Monoraphidium minutum]|nr:MAG: Alpha/Beta hydrolase protein [Monoraphidium minutum]
MAGSRQLALLMALGCCAAACCGGALAAAAPPPPSVATLVTMAKVSAAMYPPKGTLAGAVDGAFSDCARPHAPRRGFQAAAAAEIAALLKASPGDVTFFDLNVPAQAQFCHAAVVALTPSGAAAAGLPGSGPAAVVAFRGSSNIAAAAADLDKDSIPQQFRGKTVEVHKGFAASLLAPPAPNSCAMAGTGPVPDSCAAALQAHLESLSKAAGGAGPLRVAVTGHSLGAAEAALFALVLDGSPAKFAVTAYTYGQPKIGRGKGWRGVYDGPRGLSGRTFRVVHGADPVPMLASACQTRFSTKEEYEQVRGD